MNTASIEYNVNPLELNSLMAEKIVSDSVELLNFTVQNFKNEVTQLNQTSCALGFKVDLFLETQKVNFFIEYENILSIAEAHIGDICDAVSKKNLTVRLDRSRNSVRKEIDVFITLLKQKSTESVYLVAGNEEKPVTQKEEENVENIVSHESN